MGFLMGLLDMKGPIPPTIWVGPGPMWFLGEKEGRMRYVSAEVADELLEACRQAAAYHQGMHSVLGKALRAAIAKAESK